MLTIIGPLDEAEERLFSFAEQLTITLSLDSLIKERELTEIEINELIETDWKAAIGREKVIESIDNILTAPENFDLEWVAIA